MSGPERDVTENDLLAFVDGQLNGEERDRVERHLAAGSAAAVLVEEYRRQNSRLDVLYGHVAHESVPDILRPERLARARSGLGADRWRGLAAAAVLLALGTGGGWLGHAQFAGGQGAVETLVARAIEAHDLYSSEVLHPVEVEGGDSAHLQMWLSKRLDRKLTLPDLVPFGLTLVGGRLLPASDGEAAAQIMYEDAEGKRLTLYVVPADEEKESAFRYSVSEGLEVIAWEDEDIRCAMIAGLPRERLQVIAKSAYDQLI